MKNVQQKNFWIHPVLLGFYPVLALYVFNRNQIVFPAIQQAVLTSLFFTVIIIGFFLIVVRSWQNAAIHASWALLLFFSYGHIFDLVKNINFFGVSIGHRIFLPFWILLFIVGEAALCRMKNLVGLNRVVESTSVVLMALLVVQMLNSFVQAKIAEKEFSQEDVPSQNNAVTQSVNRDVYYILVDAHGRSDIIKKAVHLDISEFINDLKNLGFYVPDCAQSNYDKTQQSLTSTLNMDYLDALGIEYGADNVQYIPFIQKSRVMRRFKDMGYSTATFRSLYPGIDQQDVTYYYDYFKNSSGLDSQAALNFQYLFLRTTLLRPLIQWIESNQKITISPVLGRWIPTSNTLNSRDYRQYQQNVYALESLQNLPNIPGKKFVYAHLFITHQPFVFYPDGRFHPFLAQDYNAYRDQVIFADKRLLEIVKYIVAKSNPKPIIIIQGDHSYFDYADRVKILNAYYLPDGGGKALYPTITPVNTFRVIFNTYYGGDFKLLPDISRYADKHKVLHEAPSTCVSSK